MAELDKLALQKLKYACEKVLLCREQRRRAKHPLSIPLL